jgi:hypothetical protein
MSRNPALTRVRGEGPAEGRQGLPSSSPPTPGNASDCPNLVLEGSLARAAVRLMPGTHFRKSPHTRGISDANVELEILQQNTAEEQAPTPSHGASPPPNAQTQTIMFAPS